jgi:hypothetical protein
VADAVESFRNAMQDGKKPDHKLAERIAHACRDLLQASWYGTDPIKCHGREAPHESRLPAGSSSALGSDQIMCCRDPKDPDRKGSDRLTRLGTEASVARPTARDEGLRDALVPATGREGGREHGCQPT